MRRGWHVSHLRVSWHFYRFPRPANYYRWKECDFAVMAAKRRKKRQKRICTLFDLHHDQLKSYRYWISGALRSRDTLFYIMAESETKWDDWGCQYQSNVFDDTRCFLDVVHQRQRLYSKSFKKDDARDNERKEYKRDSKIGSRKLKEA